jgi:hypothetical protein
MMQVRLSEERREVCQVMHLLPQQVSFRLSKVEEEDMMQEMHHSFVWAALPVVMPLPLYVPTPLVCPGWLSCCL